MAGLTAVLPPMIFLPLRQPAAAALWLAFAMIAVPAGAQTLEDRMNRILADPTATAASTAAAKKVTFFCDNCHGSDGNSVIGEAPNLAQQDPAYLLNQIDKFARGQRRSKFMQGLMKVLSEDDRINSAIYYAGKKVKPASSTLSAPGQALYFQRCASCHGAKGYGAEDVPRLAGQQIPYLVESLTRYRDRTGERLDALMSSSTAGLKNADISALSLFLSSLR
jgi:cytochrome c553